MTPNPSLLALAQRFGNDTLPQSQIDKTEKGNVETRLVVALGREIWCIGKRAKYKVATRGMDVRALCVHEDRLFDGGYYNSTYDTLAGRRVATRFYNILTLCSHKGTLYDGGGEGFIYNTLDGDPIEERMGVVDALCSHQGCLYDASDNTIRDTLAGKVIATRANFVSALCSHQGKLYDTGNYAPLFETIADKEAAVTPKWEEFLDGLCSHHGRLYGYDRSPTIYDVLTGEAAWEFKKPVMAMASVPLPLWEKLARKGKKSRARKRL